MTLSFLMISKQILFTLVSLNDGFLDLIAETVLKEKKIYRFKEDAIMVSLVTYDWFLEMCERYCLLSPQTYFL